MFERTRWAALAVALAVAGAGAAVYANEGDGPRFHRRHHGFGGAFRGLDLTAEQRSSLRAIMEEQHKLSEPQRQQIRELRGQIRELLDSGRADATKVGQLTIQAHTLRLQLREAHQRAFEKFEAQLTPEQKAKLEQMKETRGKRGFGPGRGFGFGPGFGRGRPGPDRDLDDDEDDVPPPSF